MRIFNFNEFLNEEKKHFSAYKGSRSESLDHIYGVKDIGKLLEKFAPYFLKPENIDYSVGDSNLMPVYRGVVRKGKIALVKPSLHDRVSRNTENYYTLIIDDTWGNFPKRNKSLICSTSVSRANEYGKAYRIIPLDENALFGISPERDIWISFKECINELNDKLSDLFKYTSGYYNGIGEKLNDLNGFLKDTFGLEDEETLESLKNKLTVHNFVENNKSILINDEVEEDESSTDMQYLKSLSKDGSLYHLFEKAISPEFNKGFKLVKYSETSKLDFSEEKEVWTEADCLMIEAEAFDKWMRNKFYIPTSDKYGWAIKDGMSTDPRLKTDEERRQRVEDSK